MSDNYDAVYQAVRSKWGYIDSGVLMDRIVQNFDFSHQFTCAIESIGYEHCRPSAIMRPKLSTDGNQWCALYGDNLQDGVAGFGDSPAKAMQDFDNSWHKEFEK